LHSVMMFTCMYSHGRLSLYLAYELLYGLKKIYLNVCRH
jgi:hypothetical protein